MKLYLVRHGQTQWNTQGRIQGHLDSPLTPLGEHQARSLEPQLAALHVDRILSSDLGRCLATATLACPQWQHRIEPSPLLRERHFGQYQGCEAAQHPAWRSAFERRFEQDVVAIPDSEAASSVEKRIRDLMAALQRQDHQSVLLFSHGEWLRTLLNLVDQQPSWSAHSPLPGNCCLIETQWAG